MTDDTAESFGRRLRRLRLTAGLDARLLARCCRVELAIYEAWERDESEPVVRQVLALADALRCTASALLVPAELPPQTGALVAFLSTELGQAAAQHGLVPVLQRLRTARPPTVTLYAKLARVLLEGAAPDA